LYDSPIEHSLSPLPPSTIHPPPPSNPIAISIFGLTLVYYFLFITAYFNVCFVTLSLSLSRARARTGSRRCKDLLKLCKYSNYILTTCFYGSASDTFSPGIPRFYLRLMRARIRSQGDASKPRQGELLQGRTIRSLYTNELFQQLALEA
jgi:hypothetical protein